MCLRMPEENAIKTKNPVQYPGLQSPIQPKVEDGAKEVKGHHRDHATEGKQGQLSSKSRDY